MSFTKRVTNLLNPWFKAKTRPFETRPVKVRAFNENPPPSYPRPKLEPMQAPPKVCSKQVVCCGRCNHAK